MACRPEHNLEPIQKTTLSNGLRIVSCNIPHAHSVTIAIFVGVGSRYESEDHMGVSHFLEHLLFKGTSNIPNPADISATIEDVGGALNASTEEELTTYWCKVPKYHFNVSIDLLLDMLRNSLFQSSSIAKERTVVIEELNMIHDYPSYQIEDLFDNMLWPNHPLGRDIGGTIDSVSNLSMSNILNFFEEYYIPSNIVTSVAGDLTHERIVDLVMENSGDWANSQKKLYLPFNDYQSQPRTQIRYRKTEQANIALGVPSVPYYSESKYALDILSVILGEGMSSRLFVEMREERGLAYDIHSSTSYFLDCGAFVINAGVEPKNLYESVQIILDQIGNIKHDVTNTDINKARQLIIGRLLIHLEDTRSLAFYMGTQEILQDAIVSPDSLIDIISEVSLKQVIELAENLLVTNKLNLGVVGPFRGQRRLEKMLHL